MNATLRIIGYLKGTVGVGVSFQKGINLEIEAYTNVDWEGNLNCRRSTLVGGNLVTWKSKKQKVVTLSSAEAEFRGIVRGICEVLWIG